MRALLLVLLLAGCESLVQQEEPVDVICEAQCKGCEESILTCKGRGATRANDSIRVRP